MGSGATDNEGGMGPCKGSSLCGRALGEPSDEMVLAVLPEADLNKVAVLPFVGGALKGPLYRTGGR